MSKSNNKKKNSISSEDFGQNYQNVLNNYISLIKFYTNNILIIDGIEKIINSYKEIIVSFKKKLIQIKINLIKPFYNEEKQSYKYEEKCYCFYNNYIFFLNQIINIQIDSLTNIITDLNKNLFPEIERKRISDYNNSLQQNKIYIQNNQKKIEKLYNEYNSEYKKFYDAFDLIEEDVQKFYVDKRNNKISKTRDNDRLNELYNEALCTQNNYIQIHNKFQENNKKYFDYYDEKIKEFIEENNKNENYIEININFFLKVFKNSFNSYINCIEKLIKENNLNINNEKDINEIDDNLIINIEQSKKEEKASKDFIIFQQDYLLPIKAKYMNNKYKVRVIHCHILGDFQPKEDKEVMSNLFNEMGLEEYIKSQTVILTDEEIFEVIKFFSGKFDFVDTSEYNMNLEKKKIEVIKLTNKLLQPGLIRKDYEVYQDLKPINDSDIKKLEEFIKNGKEFRRTFLLRINFYRTFGIFDMPKKEFEITTNFFIQICDILINENSEDFETFKLIIIMSETFYFNNNGKKTYLYEKMKGHIIFSRFDFIKRYLNFVINEGIENNKKKSTKTYSSKEKKGIVFAILLSFCQSMLELGLTKETLLEINEPFYKEYELDEESINNINIIFKDN